MTRADDNLRVRARLAVIAFGAICFGVGVLVTLLWR